MNFVLFIIIQLVIVYACYKVGKLNAKMRVLNIAKKINQGFEEEFEKVKSMPDNNAEELAEKLQKTGELKGKLDTLKELITSL